MGLDLLTHFVRTIQPHFIVQLLVPPTNLSNASTPSKSKVASNQNDFASLFAEPTNTEAKVTCNEKRKQVLTAYVNEESLSKWVSYLKTYLCFGCDSNPHPIT